MTTLQETIQLLSSCDAQDRADWFAVRLETIRKERPDSIVFQSTLREIKGILAGMGSFSDLSLTPAPDSHLTRKDASEMQWRLVEEYDKAIGSLIIE